MPVAAAAWAGVAYGAGAAGAAGPQQAPSSQTGTSGTVFESADVGLSTYGRKARQQRMKHKPAPQPTLTLQPGSQFP
ncbi:MAG: hypothetical protein L0Y56_01405 [Nitrospira sp.]|nr:hypothetical protein [Nitrospira sp.]